MMMRIRIIFIFFPPRCTPIILLFKFTILITDASIQFLIYIYLYLQQLPVYNFTFGIIPIYLQYKFLFLVYFKQRLRFVDKNAVNVNEPCLGTLP